MGAGSSEFRSAEHIGVGWEANPFYVSAASRGQPCDVLPLGVGSSRGIDVHQSHIAKHRIKRTKPIVVEDADAYNT
jgi:hypothetical protein